MNTLEGIYRDSKSPVEYVTAYADRMAGLVKSLDSSATATLIEAVETACVNDKTVFLIANGGSAAVGGHWVNDLSANTVVEGQPGYRVISLTDNAFSITALANDAAFEKIFEIQLKANMREGDVVIAMSVSGNSPNLIHGVEYANSHGGITFCCTGMDGGKLKEIGRFSIHSPTTKDEYGPAEDMFSLIMHVVTTYLTMKRGRMLAH